MKLHRLVYDGEVLGIRVDCIPGCGYSLDLDLDLAKTLLTCIDKSKAVKSDTIPLRLIGDSVYVTDDETNVVSVENMRECLKYIPSEYRLSGCDIYDYSIKKCNILLRELLRGTNITFKEDRRSSVHGEKYNRLMFEGYDDSKHNLKFGVFLGLVGIYWRLDGSIGLRIRAEIFCIETVSLRDGCGSDRDYTKVFKEFEKTVHIDKRKVVTVPELKSVSDEVRFFKAYPDCVWLYDDVALPVDYIESIFRSDYKNIMDMFKPVVSRIFSMVSMEVLNHLGEFSDLSLEKMKELSHKYPKCYYYSGDNPIFYGLSVTESHIEEMEDTVGFERGYRKFLILDGDLYLWFGRDIDIIGCNH